LRISPPAPRPNLGHAALYLERPLERRHHLDGRIGLRRNRSYRTNRSYNSRILLACRIPEGLSLPWTSGPFSPSIELNPRASNLPRLHQSRFGAPSVFWSLL